MSPCKRWVLQLGSEKRSETSVLGACDVNLGNFKKLGTLRFWGLSCHLAK